MDSKEVNHEILGTWTLLLGKSQRLQALPSLFLSVMVIFILYHIILGLGDDCMVCRPASAAICLSHCPHKVRLRQNREHGSIPNGMGIKPLQLLFAHLRHCTTLQDSPREGCVSCLSPCTRRENLSCGVNPRNQRNKQWDGFLSTIPK